MAMYQRLVDPSTYVLTASIPPITERICATVYSHCGKDTVHLRVRKGMLFFSQNHSKVTCMQTGDTIFRCYNQIRFPRCRKILLEAEELEAPVISFKSHYLRFRQRFNVWADEREKIWKCRMENGANRVKLTVDFQDTIHGTSRHIVLKGYRKKGVFKVYLGEPKQGGILIARICVSTTSGKLTVDDYIIEIATGVDSALIVTLCLIVDDYS